MTLIKSADLDVATIQFGPLQKTPDKLYHSDATSGADGVAAQVVVQLPPLPIAGAFPDSSAKQSLYLRVDDDDLYRQLRAIDGHTVRHVYGNREAWFGTADGVSLVAVEECYRTPLSVADGTAKMRLRLDDACAAVFRGRVRVDPASVDWEAVGPIVCIAQFAGLTLRKDSITPDWVVHAVRIDDAPEKVGCLFDVPTEAAETSFFPGGDI